MGNFVTCVSCGATVPDTAYCQSCGKSMKKWCPQCGEWKASSHTQLEADDGVVYAEWQEESKHCPDCGASLQTKAAPHE
jgi:hypothetical protein